MKNKLEGEYYCNVFVHPMDNWRHGEATSMKTTVFWDVVPCSLVETAGRFRAAYCPHNQEDDGGSKHIPKYGEFLRDSTAQRPRRQSVVFNWRHAHVSLLHCHDSCRAQENAPLFRNQSASGPSKTTLWNKGQTNTMGGQRKQWVMTNESDNYT
jgi:hypothetical protein